MVLKDVCELRNCQIGQRGADRLECGIIRRKYCNVAELINGVSQLSLFEGTSNAAQACVDSAGRDVFGHRQDGIDNMNDASSEVSVLVNTSQRVFSSAMNSDVQPL